MTKRLTESQIIGILKEAEAGIPVPEVRNGPQFSDSPLSVICPIRLRPDHATCGHSTLFI